MRTRDKLKIAKALFTQASADHKLEYPETDFDSEAGAETVWEVEKRHYLDLAAEFGRALKSIGYREIA